MNGRTLKGRSISETHLRLWKGGIGKSTAVSNLAAAMAQAGKRVAVVGCDPKADSTRSLMGRRIPTVLDQLKTGATGEIAFTDSRGVRCIEAGGPEPGTGCAGRGIIVAMEEDPQPRPAG